MESELTKYEASLILTGLEGLMENQYISEKVLEEISGLINRYRYLAGSMCFAGTIDSEETMWGMLPDGRHVYVHMLPYYDTAPENERDDPEYWQKRIENGEFESENHPPSAWIQ